jgi:hypothetical protein
MLSSVIRTIQSKGAIMAKMAVIIDPINSKDEINQLAVLAVKKVDFMRVATVRP